MTKKKKKNLPPPPTVTITQQKRDRVASILAVAIGLLSIREGGAILLGVTVPAYPVLPWFVWYNVAMGAVSAAAGVGMWTQKDWGITAGVNILTLHAVVFGSLIGMDQLGHIVARQIIFAMLFRTFTWTVIVMLLKWKRQGTA